jgi:hypothetical protein
MADRAVAAQPATAVVTPRKAAAVVALEDRALERAAEGAAEAIARGGALLTPRGAPPRLRAIGLRPARPHGQAIEPAARTFMESRFGYDFSSVRIHNDAAAACAADALDAAAYTSGPDIVFGRDAYQPNAPAGRRLLGHELAHVVQQADQPQLAYRVQRQPASKTKAEPKPVWYEAARYQVEESRKRAAEEQKKFGHSFPDPTWDKKKAMLDLCEAVDQKTVDLVKERLEQVIKNGFLPHETVLYRELMTELSARLFELGLEDGAERLRARFAAVDRFGPHPDDDIYAQRRKLTFLNRLVEGAARDARHDTPEAVTGSLHRFARVFILLRDEYAVIDWDAVAWDRRTDGARFVMRPRMSHDEWARAMEDAIKAWLRGLATLIQSAMDAARRDLESATPTGTGKALLEALRNSLAGEVHDVLFPKDNKKNIAGEAFPITTTKMGKGQGTISDQYAQGKEAKARALPITTYDPEHEWARELHASLARFYRVRIDQLDVLGRIYGAIFALDSEKTFLETLDKAEKSLERAETIKRLPGGRLRLDSDDDWRTYVLQLYRDLTTAPAAVPPTSTTSPTPVPAPATRKPLTPEAALHEIIDLLFKYLHAFTVHARYTNVYDFGATDYLNRPFPRALTGQLVHDCGVYALRAAYILSLVRKELGLRFRFVTLPVHISLVITGEKFGAYIIHNDHFEHLPAGELAERRKEWEQFKDPKTQQAVPGPADEEQFIGETAAHYFIRGTDMPFRVAEVTPPTANAKTEQAKLWAQYQQINRQKLFGPSATKKGDPNYLFELRYLELTERNREVYNKQFVPFWNEKAPAAWEAFLKRVQSAAVPKTQIKVDDLLTPLGEYSFDFDEAAKDVKAAYEGVDQEKVRLSERLRADPSLAAKGARISSGIRATLSWRYHWLRHAQAIRDYETDLVGRPGDAEETVEAIQKTLKPPFMPRDQQRVEPLD